jgi:tRNA pseudouridine55 synthase
MGRRRRSGRDLHGILLLDKRLGVSSNRALQEVRRLFDANKAGHTGSLDPLATGLLPVCFGEATKVSSYLLDDDKRYHVVIQLGNVTDTGDAEGQVLETRPVPKISAENISSCLAKNTGRIKQIPPMYSALKYQGKRLYELAREGEYIERKPRSITIYDIQCLAYANELMTLVVSCSKGTYIRTLAEDIGRGFGCGAFVKELRRLDVGQFSLSKAWTLEQLRAQQDDTRLLQCLLPVDTALSTWPIIQLNAMQADKTRHGQAIVIAGQLNQGMVRMYTGHYFIGIGEFVAPGKLVPRRLFHIE